VRRDLVRVVSRLLHSEVAPAQAAKVAAKRITDADLATVRQQVDEASAKYPALRDTMPSGDQRTRRMEVVASRLRSLAQSVYPFFLSSSSALSLDTAWRLSAPCRRSQPLTTSTGSLNGSARRSRSSGITRCSGC
jgi:hypothetical protein